MIDKTALAKNAIALCALALVFAAAGVLHRLGNEGVAGPDVANEEVEAVVVPED